MAANPIVSNLDEEAVQEHPEPDPRNGSHVSPKHRAFLEAALAKNNGRAFSEALRAMPNVGLDSDFERNRG